MDLLIAGAFALAFLLSLTLTPAAAAAASRFSFTDKPGGRKIHEREMPYGGGAAVIVSFGAAAAAWWLACRSGLDGIRSAAGAAGAGAPGFLSAIFPRVEDAGGQQVFYLFCGAAACFALGMLDDARPLRPITKLAAQAVAAASVVWGGGARLTLPAGFEFLSGPATFLWLILITNSFNLLDNMDGLCAGVAGIISLLLASMAMDCRCWTTAAAMMCLAGALAGFLIHNFPPAKIFLGDAGSLFVGFLIAGCSVTVTNHLPAEPPTARLAPLALLALPVFDTASVVFIRYREGRPLLEGDTSHLSHRLAAAGMGRRGAVLALYLIALATGIPASLLPGVDAVGGIMLIFQSVIALSLISAIERVWRRKTCARPNTDRNIGGDSRGEGTASGR